MRLLALPTWAAAMFPRRPDDDPDDWLVGMPAEESAEPDVSRPSAFWRCPVAGGCFAVLNRMEHPCPLPAAASDTLARTLAGLRALDATPASPLEPTAEDLGAALAAWGAWADTVRTLPRAVAGVGV